MRNTSITLSVLLLLAVACKKEENPFDALTHEEETPPAQNLPEGNFAWLQQRVFGPTCANSGCHDGTFEPDFRSLGSSYSSLVYHPVIANDPEESFTYRVLPGDVAQSFLYERLTSFVPNTSGIMPVETDGPDWELNEAQYIAAIAAWIQAGAPDAFGRLPGLGNMEPQVTGFQVFPPGNTTTPFPRVDAPGVQPIEVPAGLVDLRFAFSDDSTVASAFTYNKVKVATSVLGFATVPELALTVGAGITAQDFTGAPTTFTHAATIDLNAYASGTELFVRVYVNDGDHDQPTEVPDDGTGPPMVDHFTLRIQ